MNVPVPELQSVLVPVEVSVPVGDDVPVGVPVGVPVEVSVPVGVGVGVPVGTETVSVGDGFKPHFIKHSSIPNAGATGKMFLINLICSGVKLVVASSTSSPNLNKLFAVV